MKPEIQLATIHIITFNSTRRKYFVWNIINGNEPF